MKRIIATVFFIVIAFSGMTSNAASTRAINDRYSYTFYNGNSSGNTAKRAKYTDKDVYIHQISGPSIKYSVQGSSNNGATWTTRSSKLTLDSGYQTWLENSVNQHGEHKARLHLVRTTTAYTNTTGYWDPDPV